MTKPDDELGLVVDSSLSARWGDGQVDVDGIYRVTWGELYEVYLLCRRRGDPESFDGFIELVESIGLDDRWFRLARALYDACLRWIADGRRVFPEWVLAL